MQYVASCVLIIVSHAIFIFFLVFCLFYIARPERSTPLRHHTQGHLQPPHHQTGGRQAALKLQHGHHAHWEQEVTDILHGLSHAAIKHFISPCKIQKMFVKKEYIYSLRNKLITLSGACSPTPSSSASASCSSSSQGGASQFR